MAHLWRARRGNAPQLTVIKGGDSHPDGVEYPVDAGMQFAADTADADRASLREAPLGARAPVSYLRTLDNGVSSEAVLSELLGAGLLPSPEESLTELLENWKPLLRPDCDSFTAEVTGIEILAMLRAASDPNQLPHLLASLIAQAEAAVSEEALAMLRVFAVVGPAELQALATSAADRMVAYGLRDQPWVSGLGRPTVGECFGYGDEFGIRTAIALTFGYPGRGHALAVLIDRELGGGVKDCWPSDVPAEVRAGYQDATRRTGAPLREYHPAVARAILERALAAPPCPMEPDQIEDVGTYLDLLRQRVSLLPAASDDDRCWGRPRVG